MKQKDIERGDGEQTVSQLMDDADRQELESLRAEIARRDKAQADLVEAQKRADMAVTIDLPPAGGAGINLNGKLYRHGQTYFVTNDIKWVLEEQMNRVRSHEASLHAPETSRKRRNAQLSGA